MGVAIGYQLRNGGIFSRIEIEYLRRFDFDYNADPLLNFADPVLTTASIRSRVSNQTLLGKIYYDMNFGIRLVPYIEAGAGISHNNINMTGSFTSPITGTIPSTASISHTNFAWEAGAGLRIRATDHLYFGIAYEFDALGKLSWEVATSPPGAQPPGNPLVLSTRDFYSNTVSIFATLKA